MFFPYGQIHVKCRIN